MMNAFLVNNLQTKPNIQYIQHNEMLAKIKFVQKRQKWRKHKLI